MWRISNKIVLNFTLWITKIEKRERKPKPFGAFLFGKKVVTETCLLAKYSPGWGWIANNMKKTFLDWKA
jgi:hypothetical protein